MNSNCNSDHIDFAGSNLFNEMELLEQVDEEKDRHPLVDMNYLYKGFRSSMKGSSWKSEPQKFESDFLHQLNLLRKDMLNREYTTSEGSEFILNERGHIRYIHGEIMRDRTIRHVFCDYILKDALSKYLIYNNGASQKGKGIRFSRDLFERDLHNYYLEYGTNDGYIVFVDFSKFYDNILHEKVKEMMNPLLDNLSQFMLSEALKNFEVDMSHLSNEDFERCLYEKFNSIEYHERTYGMKKTGEKMMPKSANIGDQVSQDIGVSFPTRVDNYVKIVLSVKRYGRYMDDMYAICRTKEEAKQIIDGINTCAIELGLFVNMKKTHIAKLSDKYTFLQIKYTLTDTGKVVKRINPKTVTRERRKLKAYKRLLNKGVITFEDVEQAYKSWMGTFAKLMSKKQVKNMKKLCVDLFGVDIRWKPEPKYKKQHN